MGMQDIHVSDNGSDVLKNQRPSVHGEFLRFQIARRGHEPAMVGMARYASGAATAVTARKAGGTIRMRSSVRRFTERSARLFRRRLNAHKPGVQDRRTMDLLAHVGIVPASDCFESDRPAQVN
jgi:hypothetical protein